MNVAGATLAASRNTAMDTVRTSTDQSTCLPHADQADQRLWILHSLHRMMQLGEHKELNVNTGKTGWLQTILTLSPEKSSHSAALLTVSFPATWYSPQMRKVDR